MQESLADRIGQVFYALRAARQQGGEGAEDESFGQGQRAQVGQQEVAREGVETKPDERGGEDLA